jgi:hypothetical protein
MGGDLVDEGQFASGRGATRNDTDSQPCEAQKHQGAFCPRDRYGRSASVQKSDADSTYLIPETTRNGSMPDFVNEYDRHIGDEASDCQNPVLECQHEQQRHRDENMLMDVNRSAKNPPRMESKPRTPDHLNQLLIFSAASGSAAG